jgi:hypothetical protein
MSLKAYRLANALPHEVHGNGFSFVCVLSWRWICSRRWKVSEQYRQLKALALRLGLLPGPARSPFAAEAVAGLSISHFLPSSQHPAYAYWVAIALGKSSVVRTMPGL